jgi:hypothetical protein
MITSAVALVVCLFAVLTRAQTPLSVSAAEAEGSKYPKPDVSARMALLYGEAFGPTDRRCVDAEKHATARSGDFVAGPFDEHVMLADVGGHAERKVWWAPRQTTTMPPMQLRAAKIGAPDITMSWSFPSVVWNESDYFFNTTIRFPEVGKWLVVVTSGSNWGCFLLDELGG